MMNIKLQRIALNIIALIDLLILFNNFNDLKVVLLSLAILILLFMNYCEKKQQERLMKIDMEDLNTIMDKAFNNVMNNMFGDENDSHKGKKK